MAGRVLLLGALAGIAGAAAMTGAMRMLHRRLPPGERYALPPREIVQGALLTQVGPTLAEPDRQRLTVAGHFGYGAAMGSLLAAVRPSSRSGRGAAYGVLVWAGEKPPWPPSYSRLGLPPASAVAESPHGGGASRLGAPQRPSPCASWNVRRPRSLQALKRRMCARRAEPAWTTARVTAFPELGNSSGCRRFSDPEAMTISLLPQGE